jgi:hypothetical protein
VEAALTKMVAFMILMKHLFLHYALDSGGTGKGRGVDAFYA